MNTPAKIGADLLQALELGDLAGVAALVDHADEEEQRAGGDAVVDHLQDAALRGPGVVSAKVPRTMKPRWATDE